MDFVANCLPMSSERRSDRGSGGESDDLPDRIDRWVDVAKNCLGLLNCAFWTVLLGFSVISVIVGGPLGPVRFLVQLLGA